MMLRYLMPYNLKRSRPDNVPNEISLRHLTVDEALPAFKQYLNDAFMAGHMVIKIIHGKSGGVIRGLVWDELKGHSLVQSYRLGEYGEGGSGVTIAYLERR
ncbi:Smr domain protein [Dehalococcoides mccartyi CBDB1]|nr:DNA mismatch repair protein MutS [Dehalococcoides mccartyi CG5]CAI83049.1 Smr domain protein [Dehalococcoides mccartyi CBDB1]